MKLSDYLAQPAPREQANSVLGLSPLVLQGPGLPGGWAYRLALSSAGAGAARAARIKH